MNKTKTEIMLECINLSIQQTNVLLLEMLKKRGDISPETEQAMEEILTEQDNLNEVYLHQSG